MAQLPTNFELLALLHVTLALRALFEMLVHAMHSVPSLFFQYPSAQSPTSFELLALLHVMVASFFLFRMSVHGVHLVPSLFFQYPSAQSPTSSELSAFVHVMVASFSCLECQRMVCTRGQTWPWALRTRTDRRRTSSGQYTRRQYLYRSSSNLRRNHHPSAGSCWHSCI